MEVHHPSIYNKVQHKSKAIPFLMRKILLMYRKGNNKEYRNHSANAIIIQRNKSKPEMISLQFEKLHKLNRTEKTTMVLSKALDVEPNLSYNKKRITNM